MKQPSKQKQSKGINSREENLDINQTEQNSSMKIIKLKKPKIRSNQVADDSSSTLVFASKDQNNQRRELSLQRVKQNNNQYIQENKIQPDYQSKCIQNQQIDQNEQSSKSNAKFPFKSTRPMSLDNKLQSQTAKIQNQNENMNSQKNKKRKAQKKEMDFQFQNEAGNLETLPQTSRNTNILGQEQQKYVNFQRLSKIYREQLNFKQKSSSNVKKAQILSQDIDTYKIRNKNRKAETVVQRSMIQHFDFKKKSGEENKINSEPKKMNFKSFILNTIEKAYEKKKLEPKKRHLTQIQRRNERNFSLEMDQKERFSLQNQGYNVQNVPIGGEIRKVSTQ